MPDGLDIEGAKSLLEWTDYYNPPNTRGTGVDEEEQSPLPLLDAEDDRGDPALPAVSGSSPVVQPAPKKRVLTSIRRRKLLTLHEYDQKKAAKQDPSASSSDKPSTTIASPPNLPSKSSFDDPDLSLSGDLSE